MWRRGAVLIVQRKKRRRWWRWREWEKWKESTIGVVLMMAHDCLTTLLLRFRPNDEHNLRWADLVLAGGKQVLMLVMLLEGLVLILRLILTLVLVWVQSTVHMSGPMWGL